MTTYIVEEQTIGTFIYYEGQEIIITPYFLLLENGDYFLLENDDKLIQG